MAVKVTLTMKLRQSRKYKTVFLSPEHTDAERAKHRKLVLQLKEKTVAELNRKHSIKGGNILRKNWMLLIAEVRHWWLFWSCVVLCFDLDFWLRILADSIMSCWKDKKSYQFPTENWTVFRALIRFCTILVAGPFFTVKFIIPVSFNVKFFMITIDYESCPAPSGLQSIDRI